MDFSKEIGGVSMKNDLQCEYCANRQVPSHFSPCLSCLYNMDKLANPKTKCNDVGASNIDVSIDCPLNKQNDT